MSESSIKLKDSILEMRSQGKKYSEIANELKCTKSVISYHCKNAGINNIHIALKPTVEFIKIVQEFYNQCKSVKLTKEKFNVSKYFINGNIKTISKRITPDQRRKNNIDNSLRFRRQNKIKLVEYMGGKCKICGYNNSVFALEFHHINPNEKEFNLTYSNKSWIKLKKEADKCILVCSNHHREIEGGLIKVFYNENNKIIIQASVAQ